MKTAALIANGALSQPERLKTLIQQHPRLIAVDGGLIHCHAMGLKPDLLVGDFDSCPSQLLELYSHIPRKTLSTHKDETDLEIAIQDELARGTAQLFLFGAWGHRIDHSLGNLLLMTRFPNQIFLETAQETLFVIKGSHTLSTTTGQTLSLLPLNGPALGIHSKGLKWELKGETMDPHFFGVSNICLKEKVEISVEKGSLLCCLLKEESREPLHHTKF